MMKPTVGRIVHYWSNGQVYAALITEIATEKFVTVTVFHPSGRTISHANIEYSPSPENDKWTWPERVA